MNWVDAPESGSQPQDEEPELERVIWRIGGPPSRPLSVQMEVDRVPLQMELGTGATVSLISRTTKEKLFPQAKLLPSKVILQTYTTERIDVIGVMKVRVKYGIFDDMLELLVVEGKGPALMGRDWLQVVRLDWQTLGIAKLSTKTSPLEDLLQKYSQLFGPDQGTMKELTASLTVRPDAKPRFFRPRPVPYALKEPIERELDRLEEAGVVEKVDYSDWAAPIVPVPKPDGSVRLCGDYKVTINPALEVDQYPLPKPADLMASLSGGKMFSKIDLSSAYQQMVLTEESRKYVTISTHRGLYRFTRLPFSVASAPALFQKAMDTILRGIPNTLCYLDDILVTGSSVEEHLANLEEVFRRLQNYGLRLKQSKCSFLQNSVEYLGHRVDANGFQASPKKVEALRQAPSPRNLAELRSCLGLINYYGRFLPNLSTLLQPLNNLLRKEQEWAWTDECEEAFQQAKKMLTSADVLVHYDPQMPLRMAGDASAYGVGAVLSHVFPDGSERPIAYASRTLSQSEQNYAQVEKEALALIFGVQKFHQYLYGREFTLVTDYRPLTTILGPKTGVPSLAAARLQRWALLLSAYHYQIEFKPTTHHSNADGLSRLPLAQSTPVGNSPEPTVFNLRQIAVLPVDAAQLASATRHDPTLSRVLRYTQSGWPAAGVPAELKAFENPQSELTVESGCIL